MPEERSNKLVFLIVLLIILVSIFLIWNSHPRAKSDQLIFLDVGQGDASFVELSSGQSLLIDAGPDKKIMASLETARPNLRHIDVAVISHPQLDHFNGFNYLLDHYSFGAFLINGRTADGGDEWGILLEKISNAGTPLITVEGGDSMTIGNSKLNLISPSGILLQSGELNDTALVALLETPSWNALFTGDIGINIEKRLSLPKIDILKVAHHGSKYSSPVEMIERSLPRIALIGAGKNNLHGHPASSTLINLSKYGSKIFRTDLQGTIIVRGSGLNLSVETER